MCGMIASNDYKFIQDNYESIKSRGDGKFSLFHIEDREQIEVRVLRNINENEVISQLKKFKNIKVPYYIVLHTRIPTNDCLEESHPAHKFYNEENHYLFHNGLITESYIKSMQEVVESKETWDTKLLLEGHVSFWDDEVAEEKMLSNIDGSFACIYVIHSKKLWAIYTYRNKNAPLYVDGVNLCSVKFKDSKMMVNNNFYKISLLTKELVKQYSFNNISTLY